MTDDSTSDKVIPIFKKIAGPTYVPEISTKTVIQKVLPYAESIFCKEGDDLLIKGDEPKAFYYLKKGSVEVSYNAEDTRVTVALLGSGDFFGEISFFDETSRVRDIRATENADISLFNNKVLNKIFTADPFLYQNFLTLITRSICSKFRQILEEREPIQTYAASLAIGKQGYREAKPLPKNFLLSPEGRAANEIVETFKAQIFELSYNLQEDPFQDIRDDFKKKGTKLFDSFNNQLESLIWDISDSEQDYLLKGYIFKEIFPFFMRSRFIERAYYKPKGYAGDFLMMEKLYRNQPEGDGKLGELIDHWVLNTKPAKGIRKRRKLLGELLASLTQERLNNGNKINIMNLACGSNRELFDFLSQCDYTEKIAATCIDIDPGALEYTNNRVDIFPHNASIRLMTENLLKWFLGKVKHDFGQQDIIYSPGLADYLDRMLFLSMIKRCYEFLKPGGILVVGNFSPANPIRATMDYVLHWELVHRDENQLKRLFAETRFKDNVKILSEKDQINFFAVAQRID